MNTEQALKQQTMKWKLYPSQETSSFLNEQKISSLSKFSPHIKFQVTSCKHFPAELHFFALPFGYPSLGNIQCQQKVTSCKQFPYKLHFPVGIALLCTALHPGRTNKARRVESKVQTGNALGNCLQT